MAEGSVPMKSSEAPVLPRIDETSAGGCPLGPEPTLETDLHSVPTLQLGDLSSALAAHEPQIDDSGIEPLQILAPVLPLPRRNSKGVQVCRRVDPKITEWDEPQPSRSSSQSSPNAPSSSMVQSEGPSITFAPHATEATSGNAPMFSWAANLPEKRTRTGKRPTGMNLDSGALK